MATRTKFENVVAKSLRELSRMDDNMDHLPLLLGGWLAYTKGITRDGIRVAGSSDEGTLLDKALMGIADAWHAANPQSADMNEYGYYIASELSKRGYNIK